MSAGLQANVADHFPLFHVQILKVLHSPDGGRAARGVWLSVVGDSAQSARGAIETVSDMIIGDWTELDMVSHKTGPVSAIPLS